MARRKALFTLPREIRPRWETPEPPGVFGSYGPQAIAWAKRERGLVPDAWQAYEICQILRHDRNGDLLCRIALTSTGRQNGKTVIVEIIIGWILDEGRTLPAFSGWTEAVAAAHDAKQARKMYDRVRMAIDLSPGLKARHTATQWAGIRAGPILFDTITGQPGSARGSTAGFIAWDEMLTQKDWDMWEAVAPTQSAQRSPLMLLTSTAGTPESVVLRHFYDQLVGIASGDREPDRVFYGAWWQSEDRDAGVGRALTKADWKQVVQANPSYGIGRLSEAAILLDHQMPADSWRRERLNHWVDTVAPGSFAPGVWARCRSPQPLADVPAPFALGVDVTPGWDRASIYVAGVRPDGKVGIEPYREFRREDGEVTAEAIIAAINSFPGLEHVVHVAYDQAMAAAPALARETVQGTWVPYQPLKPHEVTAACMDVVEMIQSGNLAHDDRLLDAQVPLAARRDVGQDGAFRFSRAASLGPIDAVMAMTFAAHSISYMAGYPSIT